MKPQEAAVAVIDGTRLDPPRDLPEEVQTMMSETWASIPSQRPNFRSIAGVLSTAHQAASDKPLHDPLTRSKQDTAATRYVAMGSSGYQKSPTLRNTQDEYSVTPKTVEGKSEVVTLDEYGKSPGTLREGKDTEGDGYGKSPNRLE
eukprot:TRINITY_DN359_c0_g1_i1.p1 TRINITY_DN359_c0_g1~~TRINITY_DN359_c0_g1_i1.p1  ORF type:complete len:146 (+),score=22.81 TRINITY_DN359_c0_g1_i1:139-576(+)